MRYLAFLSLILLTSCQSLRTAFTPKNGSVERTASTTSTSTKEEANKTTSTTYKNESQRLANARKLIGTKYQYGGESTKEGFDCSGLSWYVFKKEGIQLPRVSRDQAQQGRKIPTKKAQPGDLIFFKNKGVVNHVGIVSTNLDGKLYMIHSSSSRGVVEDPIAGYWEKRLAFVRRMD